MFVRLFLAVKGLISRGFFFHLTYLSVSQHPLASVSGLLFFGRSLGSSFLYPSSHEITQRACFPLTRVSPSSVGIYHALMKDVAVTRTVASWPGWFLLRPCGFSAGTVLHFPSFTRLIKAQTHQRSACLTTTPRVCSSLHLFLPGLTGAFHTDLACCYCLSLLSITQIGAACIHMHAFGTLGQPLAACSGGVLCQPLFSLAITGDCSSMSSVICMV